MTAVEKLILENQKIILLGISALLTPKCRGMMDANGETKTNVRLIERYKETSRFLEEAALKDGGEWHELN
jgi:hypothetical protein